MNSATITLLKTEEVNKTVVADDYNPPPMRAPYKGVLPYFEQDAEFFFGRESETELICEILRAARVTILFGARGIGKTSLLRAGVVPHLKHTATQPERVIVFDSWRDNPIARFTNSLRQLGREPVSNFLSLNSVLTTLTRDETLLIILDQFEECAVRHQPFAAELARLASQSDAPVHFLLSVRDEAEPALRSLQARFPNLFSNMLRLLPLSSDAARRAIVGPIEVFNSRNPGLETRIEPAAIEAILESAKNPAANNLKIDTAKLQRILAALWEHEFNSGVDTMRLSSLNALMAEDGAAAQKDGEFLDYVWPSTIIASQEHLPYSVPVLTGQAREVRKQNWFPAYATALVSALTVALIFYLARTSETENAVAVAVPPRIAPLPAPEPQAAAPETAPTPVREMAAPPPKPQATTPMPSPEPVATPNVETLAASSPGSAMPPSAPEVAAPPPDAPQKPAPETNRVETSEFGAKGRREETVPPAGSSANTGTPQLALAPRTENPPRFEIEEQTADDNRDEAAESGTKNPPVVKREKTAPKSEMPQYAAAAPGESKPDTRRERVKAADAPVKREFSPPASTPAEASVFIHIREESPVNARLIQKLEKNGIDVSGIKKVDRGPRAIDLRYFRPSEKKEANEIAKELKRLDIQVAEVKYIKGYEEIAKNRQYELWFPAEAFQ